MGLQPVQDIRKPPHAVLWLRQGNLDTGSFIDDIALAAGVEADDWKPVRNRLQHHMGRSFYDTGQQKHVHLAHHVQYLTMRNGAIPVARILHAEGVG